MKTEELTGAALDWVVAKCEGFSAYKDDFLFHTIPHYSTDWAQGGPIIERERIGVEPWGADMRWLAQTYNEAGRVTFRQYGSTPLIAAMRCYVASKLGDDVTIPKELK